MCDIGWFKLMASENGETLAEVYRTSLDRMLSSDE
jgi:hypothetical protein